MLSTVSMSRTSLHRYDLDCECNGRGAVARDIMRLWRRQVITLLLMQSVTAAAFSVTTFYSCHTRTRSSLDIAMVSPEVSLGAGMVAGALGKGVAYPIDTIKTKQQLYAGEGSASSPFSLVSTVLKAEGVSGFYGGVSSTMAGEAVIKGAVFFTYDFFNALLGPASQLNMIIAAGISGAVASVVATPVERVKVVMQAGQAGQYASPLACILSLVRTDGVEGLFFRGLVATLLREIPAYIFYFTSYEYASTALLPGGSLAGLLPPSIVPVVGGAVAGVMCWVPIYPIDVVKTNMQAGDGAVGDSGFVGTAREIFDAGGLGAFYDGLGPKVLRAVVNHAVTFYVYELICEAAAA